MDQVPRHHFAVKRRPEFSPSVVEQPSRGINVDQFPDGVTVPHISCRRDIAYRWKSNLPWRLIPCSTTTAAGDGEHFGSRGPVKDAASLSRRVSQIRTARNSTSFLATFAKSKSEPSRMRATHAKAVERPASKASQIAAE